MTHPDDHFKLSDCPRCEALAKELQEKQNLLLMYREQIRQYQQAERKREDYPLWYRERGSGVAR